MAVAWETVNKLQNTHSAKSTREKKSEKKKTPVIKEIEGDPKDNRYQLDWIMPSIDVCRCSIKYSVVDVLKSQSDSLQILGQ